MKTWEQSQSNCHMGLVPIFNFLNIATTKQPRQNYNAKSVQSYRRGFSANWWRDSQAPKKDLQEGFVAPRKGKQTCPRVLAGQKVPPLCAMHSNSSEGLQPSGQRPQLAKVWRHQEAKGLQLRLRWGDWEHQDSVKPPWQDHPFHILFLKIGLYFKTSLASF